MRNLHKTVINDVGEMVRRIPVRLEDDKVLLSLLLLERPVDGVLEAQDPKGIAPEAHDVGLTRRGALFCLGGGDGAACPWVGGWQAGVVALEALLLEVFGGAETAVCVASVYEFLDVGSVDVQPFRLDLSFVRSLVNRYRGTKRDLTCR